MRWWWVQMRSSSWWRAEQRWEKQDGCVKGVVGRADGSHQGEMSSMGSCPSTDRGHTSKAER